MTIQQMDLTLAGSAPNLVSQTSWVELAANKKVRPIRKYGQDR